MVQLGCKTICTVRRKKIHSKGLEMKMNGAMLTISNEHGTITVLLLSPSQHNSS